MNKKNSIVLVLLFIGVVSLLIGVTYSFFNYTRTGSSNVLSTGEINFTSDYEGITLQNVFPISSSDLNTDTDNVATVRVHIEGNTNYENGLRYIVQIVDLVDNLPISLDISSENLNNIIIRNTYRGGVNHYGANVITNIQDGNILAAGLIPANTNVDGDIIIKAYLDKDFIAITDTYDPVYENRGDGYQYYTTDENGTTYEWVEGENNDYGRYVYTTEEWNSYNEMGVSFKVKVETNVDQNIIIEYFPDSIASESENIKEVYFIKDTEENINNNYNNATVKADMSLFGDGKIKSYLVNDKLYIACSEMIYINNGFSFYNLYYNDPNTNKIVHPVEKIIFDNVNTSNVTYMRSMFSSLENLTTLDLSNFDTSNVIDMSMMFLGCTSLTTIYVSNLWSIESLLATNSSRGMFGLFSGTYTSNLVGGAGTVFNSSKTDKEYARIDGGPSNPGYFTLKTN